MSDTTRAEQLFKEREDRDNTIKAQEEARVRAMRDQIQRLPGPTLGSRWTQQLTKLSDAERLARFRQHQEKERLQKAKATRDFNDARRTFERVRRTSNTA